MKESGGGGVGCELLTNGDINTLRVFSSHSRYNGECCDDAHHHFYYRQRATLLLFVNIV